MPFTCCVVGCKNMKWDSSKQCSLFRFPSEQLGVFSKSLKELNNQQYKPHKSSRICQKHFEGRYVKYLSSRIALTDDAVPTIFMNSGANKTEVIDYLITQNDQDPLETPDEPIHENIFENPPMDLSSDDDKPLRNFQRSSENPKRISKPNILKKYSNTSPAQNLKRKSETPNIFSKEKRLSSPGDVFNNMEDISVWTLTEIKNSFNILKKTLDQRTKKIQALTKRNYELESLLARFGAEEPEKPSDDSERQICKICSIKCRKEPAPFHLNVQISDGWLPTFLSKFKTCSGDVLLTKNDESSSPICHLCLQQALADYSAVFNGGKEVIKKPALNAGETKIQLVPKETVKKVSENTSGKVIILKKISRSNIPDKLKQITMKKPKQNPNVKITRTTVKTIVKPKLIESTIQEAASDDIICEYCGERFTEKRTHLQHQSTHWADLRFVCKNCDTCFLTDSDLKMHSVVHCKDVEKA